MGFFINTSVNEWIKNSGLLPTQADILASEHNTLNHNSFVDCLELYEFEETELAQVRNPVSRTAKASIKRAVGNSKTLITKHKRLIRDS